MKIRGLFAGLVAALVLSACTGSSPTAPQITTGTASFDETVPPSPVDTIGMEPSSGGTMGNGG